ncbi:unnamed protein product, partial [Closterium sp. NIES-54]
QVAASCSCRLLSHQTLLWHHRLGHPSLPRLRGMHSRLLVSGLPRSLPPLPPSPAPPCIRCVEGRQRAAPHSSSFPPTTAPLQTLHMDVWGPARVSGQSPRVSSLMSWIHTVSLVLRERFGQDLPILRLHSVRGGEFTSNILWDFCCGEGILQSFKLPDSPQQNGIAERRIGLVMEVARTFMIHAAHQLNLWHRVSLPKTSPTLRWTGEVGDALVFRVWGSRAFVRDRSADKLSPRAIPCVFLGFFPNAPGWQIYHPTSRPVFPSQDVTFDELVPFYRLFPYRSAHPPPPPLFLAPGPPPVAFDSGAARGAASWGAEPGGAESEGAETRGAEPGGVEPGGAEPGGVATRGGEPGGAEPEGVEPGGAEPGGAEPGVAALEGAEFPLSGSHMQPPELHLGTPTGHGAAAAAGAAVAAVAAVAAGAAVAVEATVTTVVARAGQCSPVVGRAGARRQRFIDEEQGGRVPKTPVSVDAYAGLTFDDEEAQEREEEEYRQKVGSLHFVATMTRPDIEFACSKLTVRSDQHWREVDHCLAYLADTRDTALEFGGGPESLELIGYVDADDAGDKQNQTSTGGYVFVYGGAAVFWQPQAHGATLCLAAAHGEAREVRTEVHPDHRVAVGAVPFCTAGAVMACYVTVDSAGVGARGAAAGGTRSGGARSRGAGAGGAGAGGVSFRGAGAGGFGTGGASIGGAGAGGAGVGGASSGGAGAGGSGTGGASSRGVGAGGAGTGSARSGGAGAGGAGAVGAGTEETEAGGSPTASPTAPPHRHNTCFQALRRLERKEQE